MKSNHRHINTKFAAVCVALFTFMAAACSKDTASKAGSEPPSLAAAAAGGWESSGGDGVACFQEALDASTARSEINSQGFLSTQTRSKIQSVVTLDSWDNITDVDEYAKQGKIVFTPTRYFSGMPLLFSKDLAALKDQSQIVDRIIRSMSISAPLFAERLEALRARFPLSNWEPSAQVPQVDDSVPKKEIDRNGRCVLIQLANRYAHSSAGQVPDIKIVYDKELVGKFLSPIEQGMLVLHEYLYTIAKETGHKDSNVIRRLNALLFALEIPVEGVVLSIDALLMRRYLDYPYGDYMRFFLKDDEFSPRWDQLGTQASRYDSLISMMTKMREEIGRCLKSGKKECAQSVIEGNSVSKRSFTSEEAFLFLGRFYLDQEMTKYNSELLSARNLKIPQTEASAVRKQLSAYCKFLQEKPPLLFLDLVDRALLYCRDQIHEAVTLFSERSVERKSRCEANSLILNGKQADGRHVVLTSIGTPDALSTMVMSDISDMWNPLMSRVNVQGKLIQSKPTSKAFDHGMGNKAYTAQDTYHFAIGADDDAFPFRKLAVFAPDVVKSVSINIFEDDVRLVELTGQAALKFLNGDRSDFDGLTTAIDGITLSLPKCNVFETNLPYAPDDFELTNNRARTEKFKMPEID